MWCIQGQESGEYQEFKTKKEAKDFIKQVHQFDKRNGLDGEEFDIWFEEDN